MLRSSLAAALLLLSAPNLFAQRAPAARVVLVPQVGAIVNWSYGSDASAMASLVAEVPVHHAFSVTAEGTAALGKYANWACAALGDDVCIIPTAIRAGAAAGVVAHPVRLGRLVPYAGASYGFARWTQNQESGVAPMASLRAGLDLQIASAVGVRAELVRRIAWTSTPDAWPLHADVFSIGARVAIGR